MNSLNREIDKFECVVVSGKGLPMNRRFICEGGFGMSDYTSGGKIFGYWLDDGCRDMIRGEWIDSGDTLAFGKLLFPQDMKYIMQGYATHFAEYLDPQGISVFVIDPVTKEERRETREEALASAQKNLADELEFVLHCMELSGWLQDAD